MMTSIFDLLISKLQPVTPVTVNLCIKYELLVSRTDRETDKQTTGSIHSRDKNNKCH